jgi:hypothetical protein
MDAWDRTRKGLEKLKRGELRKLLGRIGYDMVKTVIIDVYGTF